MPSSKDPVINRQKAKEWRLKNPERHRESNRLWAQKKRARQTHEERNAVHLRAKQRDPIGYLVHHARNRARKLGVPFDLSVTDLQMPDVCPVFGLPFEWGRGKMGWRNMRSPSLDRIKPQKGYVRGNVVIISNRANHIKGNASISEMEAVLSYMKAVGANLDLSEQIAEAAPLPQDQLFLLF